MNFARGPPTPLIPSEAEARLEMGAHSESTKGRDENCSSLCLRTSQNLGRPEPPAVATPKLTRGRLPLFFVELFRCIRPDRHGGF